MTTKYDMMSRPVRNGWLVFDSAMVNLLRSQVAVTRALRDREIDQDTLTESGNLFEAANRLTRASVALDEAAKILDGKA